MDYISKFTGKEIDEILSTSISQKDLNKFQEDFENSIDDRAPHIKNGNWYVWDKNTKNFVDTGISAQGLVPEKGKDYFTADEINSIKEDVKKAVIESFSFAEKEAF